MLALYDRNPPVTPHKDPVMQNCYAFFLVSQQAVEQTFTSDPRRTDTHMKSLQHVEGVAETII